MKLTTKDHADLVAWRRRRANESAARKPRNRKKYVRKGKYGEEWE